MDRSGNFWTTPHHTDTMWPSLRTLPPHRKARVPSPTFLRLDACLHATTFREVEIAIRTWPGVFANVWTLGLININLGRWIPFGFVYKQNREPTTCSSTPKKK